MDDLLLNVLVLTVPILIYYILWLDRSRPIKSRRCSQLSIAIICSLAAVFCMSHPLFAYNGSEYDLRVIPVLAAFLYSGIGAGLIVSAVIIAYRYYIGGPELVLIVSLIALLVPFILAFISLSNWKQRTTKVMFPSLLAFVSALAAFCINLVYRIQMDEKIDLRFWMYGGLFCLIHMVTMLMLTYLIERIRENMSMRSELQRSEKLHVLSELAASVAHEIRNPMTVARGFMQILSQSQVTEEKKRIYTSMVIEEIDRAQSIISDYLSFAKPQAEKTERLDASTLTQKLGNLINPYASLRGVQISFDMESPLWIIANYEKMIQCLVNLTKNGIEAMPNGGTLQISGYKRGSKIILEIRDSGIGMTAEQIEQLGTPFYSTKHKGTGLGMMVSFRIVKNLGGTIEVRSQPGKGTCFMISLPAL